MGYRDLEGHDAENDMEAAGGRELHDRRRRDKMGQALDTQRDATVVQVNGQGFKTELGDWVNVSKFARPEACVMPAVGDRVRLVIDKAGFIRRISGLTDGIGKPWPPPADVVMSAAPTIVEPAVEVPTESTPPAESPAFVGRIEQDSRGVVISRLATLNTATAILSSGGRATSESEVLALAAHLEAWATR